MKFTKKELENSDKDNPVRTNWLRMSTPTVGIPREKASDFLEDEIGLRDEDNPSLFTEKRTRIRTARKALRMIAQRIADNRKIDKIEAKITVANLFFEIEDVKYNSRLLIF